MESQEQQQLDPPAPPLLDQQRRSKPPTKLLVSRSYTIAVLLISLILLYTLENTDKVTGAPPPMLSPPKKCSTDTQQPPPPPPPPSTSTKSELGSIRPVLTVPAVIGIGCNLFQLSMLIYCMVTGKNLTRNKYNVFFDYYCDQVVALLLSASAGVGLGSMLDIKYVNSVLSSGSSAGVGLGSLGKISTTLLASATISTSVSSTCSSEALQEYKRTLEKGEKAVGMLGSWATKAYQYCCYN